MFQMARSLAKAWLKQARVSRLSKPRRARLGMEALEDRVVPVTWLVNLPDGLGACNPASVSLRQAVICANPANDTIQIDLPGTYLLSLGSAGDANPASGDIDIIGKTNLNILTNPLFPRCAVTIDAQWSDRIFDVAGNSSVQISNINLENGVAWDSTYSNLEDGGAIRNYGTLQYNSCTIRNSVADNGGGIGNLAGSLTLGRVVLDTNYAQRMGGGVYNRGTMQFTNGTVSNNQAPIGGGVANLANATITNVQLVSNGASFGGGLYNTGSAQHTRALYVGNWAWEGGGIHTVGASSFVMLQGQSEVNFNQADRGGGIFSETSNVIVRESTADGNYASREGGGIWAIAGRLNVEKSTVARNYAAVDGGGVWTASGTTMHNSTISTNYAGNVGGGIYYSPVVAAASLTTRHATITENWALVGGGLYHQAGGAGLPLIINTIIAINWSFGGNNDDGFGPMNPTSTNNLIGVDWLGSNFSNVTNLLNVPNASVGLGPLQNNGGPTETHALLLGSVAIDAASAVLSHTFNDDQRGNPRPGPGGMPLLPDIGAFEL